MILELHRCFHTSLNMNLIQLSSKDRFLSVVSFDIKMLQNCCIGITLLKLLQAATVRDSKIVRT